jgi:hypothetical protein
MLTFKFLIINDVALWKSLLTSVLTFNLLAINSVTLVDLYTRYTHLCPQDWQLLLPLR